ncbi:translocation/assembly module TamB domain-containing protein [Falsiroseomonas stagni]|uniref:translocation/assembly module TamB domain-containing protein n=1 Tax=Falsiroseomonas stagni TaxID=484882 RepID=UPI001113B581|nr:translocation/assembly module TamB domain-containing protein [Falsiroseomonas stagni]
MARPSEVKATAAPPRRRLRWLRRAGGVLLALLLLPLVAVGGALLYANSEGGRARIAALVAAQVPGLALEGLEGPLPGRLALARVTMADSQGVWLEVEGARLAWDPLALLGRQAHVTLLAADRVALHRLPEAGPDPAPPEPPGPLIPELPELPLGIRLDRLEVARIEIGPALAGEAAALRLAGNARLDPRGLTAALDVNAIGAEDTVGLEASLRPGSGRLSARVTLRGAAGGPVARLAGLVGRAPSLDLTLDGPAEGAALSLRADAGPGLSAVLDGTIRAPDTTRLGLDITGRLDASGLLESPLAGPLDIALRGARMPDGATDLAALRIAGRAGVAEAAGRILADGRTISAEARIALAGSEVFAPLLAGAPIGWSALEATVKAEGPMAAPTLDVTLAPEGFSSSIAPVSALLGPAPRASLRATLPDRIALLTVTGAALRAEVSGLAGTMLDLRFAADVAAAEGAVPGVAGALRLSGTATGEAANPTLAVTAASDRLEAAGQVLEALTLEARVATPATLPSVAATLEGRFQGLPLALNLQGSPDGDGALRLRAATARLGPMTLEAAGRLTLAGPVFEGQATLAAPDLAPLSAPAGQPLAGAIRLEAIGTARDGAQHLEARLTAPRLLAAGVEARDLAATVTGTAADAEFRLSGRAMEIDAELRGRLTALAEGARRIELSVLRATTGGETIRLAAPARIGLRADGGVEIGALSLAASRGATLRAEGSWGPERADIRATLAVPDLAALAPLAPGVEPAGRVTAEARITGRVASPELTATLRGTGLRAAATRGLPAGDVTADIRRDAAGLATLRGTASLGPQTRLTATGRLAANGGIEGALDGTIDIGGLAGPLLAAGADRVAGRATVALRASGTLAAPVLGGEARLAAGSWRNAVMGVAFTDLGGTIRADGSRLRLDLAGRTAGQGRLTLAGSVDPLADGIPVDLVLRAQAAQPVASDLVRATLDAEVTLRGAVGTGLEIAGPIRVARMDIRIPDQLPGSVRSLGSVTEVGRVPGRPAPPRRERRAPEEPGAPITLALRVEAPRNIFVRGRGVDAELGGTLQVGGRVDAPDIAGEIALRRGEISVLARRLTLTRGRLDFQGGLLPELDFEGSSQAGGTTVRATVTGPPNAPVIGFNSTPELPQDEVLARLLFDRPVSDLSPFEGAQLAQAIVGATGVAGGGASGVLDRLRRTFALDRLAVGGGGESASRTTNAEERNGPTLEAGRYIADGVYVGVRQGTDSGSSRVGVRVDLTPRIRLEAETGDREAGERVGVSMEWQWGR